MEHPLGSALRMRVLPDGGATPIPIVWDEDVAEAVMLAIEKGEGARGAFNLCATDLLPASELARAVGIRSPKIPKALLAAGARLGPVMERAGLGPAMDPDWLEQRDTVIVPDVRKAREVLGWSPTCPTATDVLRKFLAVVPERADPRISLFMLAVD